MYLSIFLFLRLSVYLSIYPSIYLPTYLSMTIACQLDSVSTKFSQWCLQGDAHTQNVGGAQTSCRPVWCLQRSAESFHDFLLIFCQELFKEILLAGRGCAGRNLRLALPEWGYSHWLRKVQGAGFGSLSRLIQQGLAINATVTVRCRSWLPRWYMGGRGRSSEFSADVCSFFAYGE